MEQLDTNHVACIQMSARASGGAGGDDKKLNKASKCEKCGNRHKGACLPKCGICGKTHQGTCRYANPISTIGFGHAGREPSQAEMAARFDAQQVGYQQAYNEMRLSGMGPGTVPGMGGQVFGPVGGFGSPYPGHYGGFGILGNPGWVNQGWGNPVPVQFGQGYGGFPNPPMGQSTFGSFGNVSQPASNYGGHKQGAAMWHEIQKKTRGPRDNRKPRSKEQHKDKKDEKGPLAVKDAGIEKPISKGAKQRAKKRASEKKKKEEEPEQDPLTGPADTELLGLFAEQKVELAGTSEAAPIQDEDMGDLAPQQEDAGIELGNIDAQSLIEEAIANPSGLQFPQDRVRVEYMAKLLEQFGQDRLLGLSESAAMNRTTIVWEAFQQDLYDAQISEMAAMVPLPESGIEENIL